MSIPSCYGGKTNLCVGGQWIRHCWFGTGGTIGSLGWFSDMGRADAYCGDAGSMVEGAVPMMGAVCQQL